MKLIHVFTLLAVTILVSACGNQDGIDESAAVTDTGNPEYTQTLMASASTGSGAEEAGVTGKTYSTVELRAWVMNGRGLISSNPAGIYCGEDSAGRINKDCSENYSPGKTIVLKARPISGWALESWSGACSGKGSCRVTITKSKPKVYVFAHFTPLRKFGY